MSPFRRPLLLLAAWAVCAALPVRAGAQGFDPQKLPGIVLDDADAVATGTWTVGTTVRPFLGVGYRHDDKAPKGSCTLKFEVAVPADGMYRVLLAYTPSSNRTRKLPVQVVTADGPVTVALDQTRTPELPPIFAPLGEFRFAKDQKAIVVIDTTDTQGVVVVDGLLIQTEEQYATLEKGLRDKAFGILAAAATKPAKTPAPPKPVAPKPAAEPAPPPPAVVNFVPQAPAKPLARLTTQKLDELLEQQVGGVAQAPLVYDEQFLRRVTLDLCGRQPTLEEIEAFAADAAEDKRPKAVERLLASPDYGRNWSEYWSDVVGYRQQEPELTFHDYRPFKQWLAGRLNEGTRWDEIVFRMLTAQGKVGDRPEATFIGFHQGNPGRLAGESSRVFLGVQIQCAECHDHPFVELPQKTFHGMAAFFARTNAKIAQLDSALIEVSSKPTGEHRMPGGKDDMRPTVLGGDALDPGLDDLDRRARLASWIVSADNTFFARAYVNRIWDRLMGRGFFDPVDDMGQGATPVLPELHAALAEHFVATGYDHRDLFRLVANSRAYQRTLETPEGRESKPFAAAVAKQLRGDEVFQSLVTAIGLPNVTPPRAAKTSAVRFPPPPKSTRDLVVEAFGFDPSFRDQEIVRTLKQAMFLMNNAQVQKQVDASPGADTMLSKLLAAEPDDRAAAQRLFKTVLARTPSDKELDVLVKHVERIGDRARGFEDVLWSLLNSAEFTTRR